MASSIGAFAPQEIWGWKIIIIFTLNLKCMMILSSFKIQSLCLVSIFLIINLNNRLTTVINFLISIHIWLFKSDLNWFHLNLSNPQVTSRLQEGDFAAFPELTTVAQLLAGQEEALHQAAERCETW